MPRIFDNIDQRLMELDWRRKTSEEVEALWTELGFTSSFWTLPRQEEKKHLHT